MRVDIHLQVPPRDLPVDQIGTIVPGEYLYTVSWDPSEACFLDYCSEPVLWYPMSSGWWATDRLVAVPAESNVR